MKYLLLILLFSSATQATELKLSTFNTGLAYGFVAHAKERLPQIIQALQKSDSDVLCLQEVWKKRDRKKIVKALKSIYPFSFQEKGEQLRASHAPVCKIKDLFGEGKFLSCMLKNCMDGDSDQQTVCSRTTCGPALDSLKSSNRECASTLMAQVGKSTLVSMYNLFEPFVRPGMFAYKGENGVLLLSKYPMSNKAVIDWKKTSTLNHRVALNATITKDGKQVRVSCTHLTANLDRMIPYTGIFQNWEEENSRQVEKLISSYEDTTLPTFLMGDFNCSFADSERAVEGDFERACAEFTGVGYADPSSEQPIGPTFSYDNNLVDKKERQVTLDHIFVRNAVYFNTKVILNQKVEIEKKKATILTNLSDHYGLSIEAQF